MTYLKQPTFYPTFKKGKSLLYDDLFNNNLIESELIQPNTSQEIVLSFNFNHNSQVLTFKASTTNKYFLIDLI